MVNHNRTAMGDDANDESVLVAIIKHNKVIIQSWAAKTSTMLDQTEEVLEENDKIREVCTAIRDSLVDLKHHPKPTTKMVVLIEQPIRNGVPTKPFRGIEPMEVQNLLIGGLGRPVQLANVDDMIALAAWEKVGYGLQEDPVAQLKWARNSRVVSIGLHHNGIGIGFINNGMIIGGMSVPQDAFPWSNIKASNAPEDLDESKIDTGYYTHLLRMTVRDYVRPQYAPDKIIMTIDHKDLHGSMDDYSIMYHDLDHDEIWYAGYGAMMFWRKEQIGWRPMFIDEAIRRDDEEQSTLEIVLGGEDGDDEDTREEEIFRRINARMNQGEDDGEVSLEDLNQKQDNTTEIV